MRFVLSDESINVYGFRVLTAGIQLERFKKNPVMLYEHDNYSRQPIGRWDDIKVEDGKLTAEAVFDEKDEFAQKIKAKAEQDMMNGCSVGIEVLETSTEPDHLQAGQRRPTVTKSEVYEASICALPANKNALKLHFDKGVTLSGNFDEESLQSVLPLCTDPNPTHTMNLENVANTLGLSAGYTQQDIEQKVNELTAKATLSQKSTDVLIKLGRKNGLVTDENEALYRSLAQKDFDSVLSLMDVETDADPKGGDQGGAKESFSMSDLVHELRGGKQAPEKGFSELSAEERVKLKAEEPEKYRKLYRDYYKRDCEI